MVTNQTFYIVVGSLIASCFMIITLFSLTVLIIIQRHWHTRCRSIPNLLTCNTSIALLFHVTTISIQAPLYTKIIYFNLTDIDPIFCQISACLATFSTAALTYSFLVQAISRFFIAILYKHRVLLTFRTNWIMIIISWIGSAMLAGGMFLSPLAYQYEVESHFCVLTTKNFRTSFIVTMLTGISTISIILILYGIILYHTTRHTRINPNGASTLRARRNKAVFKKIFVCISILTISSFPYLLCSVLSWGDRASWPLYSIALVTISFALAINSIVLLVTNDQVKGILRANCLRQRNVPNNIKTIRINQIIPHSTEMRPLRPLPMIA